jgi:hypothetical protein
MQDKPAGLENEHGKKSPKSVAYVVRVKDERVLV